MKKPEHLISSDAIPQTAVAFTLIVTGTMLLFGGQIELGLAVIL